MKLPATLGLPARSALAWLLIAAASPAGAAMLQGQMLVDALRKGGYVLVMRHPSSPFAAPERSQADAGNTNLERQLDDKGKTTARAMGEAFRQLRIPVGRILSSPTFRAMEGVRLSGLGTATTAAELDEGAQGMKAAADSDRSRWLRARAAEAPRAGSNTLIVTHTPNMVGAFGEQAAGVAAGEALVFQPEGSAREPTLVARVKIEDWPRLAGEGR